MWNGTTNLVRSNSFRTCLAKSSKQTQLDFHLDLNDVTWQVFRVHMWKSAFTRYSGIILVFERKKTLFCVRSTKLAANYAMMRSSKVTSWYKYNGCTVAAPLGLKWQKVNGNIYIQLPNLSKRSLTVQKRVLKTFKTSLSIESIATRLFCSSVHAHKINRTVLPI